MNFIFEIILSALLLVVFIQDIKYRAIHVLLPILIVAIGLYLFFQKGYNVYILISNLFFLVAIFLGLYIYLGLKEMKFIDPFYSIGKGDFLFFIAVIPFFSTTNYILYFTTGMIFSIISFLIMKTVSKTGLVPLAGLLALYMLILKGVFFIAKLNFFETNLIWPFNL